MSNVVTLQGQNPTQEIISHFLDQFNANQRSRAEVGVQQQQLDQSASQHNDNFGLLQKQYEQKLAEYNDKQLTDDAVPVKARLASFYDAAQSSKDPNEQAALMAQAKAFFDSLDPRMQAKVKLDALAPIMTTQRQSQLNTNTFSAKQTGIAAGGGTDPNAVNFTTKMATNSFMPPEGFTQQQATDLAARDRAPDSAGTPTPNLASKIPAPSGNAVSDYEARQTGAMPTAPQNQTAQTAITQTGMQEAGANTRQGMQNKSAMEIEKLRLTGGQTPASVQDMVTSLVNRRASLDDFAKKGSPLRNTLIQAMPAGTIAPSNEKERTDLVSADNTARLMYDRITKLRELAPVVDSNVNRLAIGGLLNSSDTVFGNWLKGAVRQKIDPKVLDYVQELRNLREDQFSLRKFLGNSPVRSDKQVNIMLSQSVGADAGNAADVNRMLDVFEPAVRRLITGNQGAGAPYSPPDNSGGAITTPDGLKWKKNPDGSMTQVQ